jgi:riboflavin kinase/FMN adenylyltransferase
MVRDESVLAIGEYDGFHLGHGDVVRAARRLARSTDRAAVAVVVAARDDTPRLLSMERRCVLAIQAGADWAAVVEADRADPGDDLAGRLSTLVGGRLGARAAVLTGALDDGPCTRWPALRPALARRGVEVHEVRRRRCRTGSPLTSEAVIACVEAGDVEAAGELLGRPVEMDGVVVRGDQLGRQLGYPTANVVPDTGRVWAAFGVYASYAVLPDGRRALATVNVGVRPTVGGGGRPLVEAHLLDFCDDLYGCRLRIDLVRRLRSEHRFDSIGALVDQIAGDVRATRDALTPRCS